jgi:hypothetical protein
MINRYSLPVAVALALCVGLLQAQNAEWEVASTRNDGLAINSIQVTSTGRIFICSFGTIERSDDLGATWQPSGSGITSLYIGSLLLGQNDELFAIGYDGVFRTTNGGENWSKVNAPGTNFTGVFAARNGDVYVGVGNGIAVSHDHGATWSMGATQESGAAFAEGPSGKIFAAMTDSGVYRSDDRGATWSVTSLANLPVGLLAASGSGTLLAATVELDGMGRVYRSVDGGGAWNSTTLHERCIAMIALPDGSFVASTANAGIVRSTDDGQTWKTMNVGLLDQRIFALGYHPSGWLLASDPFGRLYRTPRSVASAEDANGVAMTMRFSPNPISTSGFFSFTLSSAAHVRLVVSDVRGEEEETIIDEELPAGEHRAKLDATRLPAGVYLYRLAAGDEVGMGRIVVVR